MNKNAVYKAAKTLEETCIIPARAADARGVTRQAAESAMRTGILTTIELLSHKYILKDEKYESWTNQRG